MYTHDTECYFLAACDESVYLYDCKPLTRNVRSPSPTYLLNTSAAAKVTTVAPEAVAAARAIVVLAQPERSDATRFFVRFRRGVKVRTRFVTPV